MQESRHYSILDTTKNPDILKMSDVPHIRPTTLCQLPAELKLRVFRYLPDCDSIISLSRFNRAYRAIYHSSKSSLLTATTLSYLLERDFDPFMSWEVVEIGAYMGWGLTLEMREAVRTVYAMCHEHVPSGGRGIMKLPLRMCRLLLDIEHYMMWRPLRKGDFRLHGYVFKFIAWALLDYLPPYIREAMIRSSLKAHFRYRFPEPRSDIFTGGSMGVTSDQKRRRDFCYHSVYLGKWARRDSEGELLGIKHVVFVGWPDNPGRLGNFN